jgi:hypothetical protein
MARLNATSTPRHYSFALPDGDRRAYIEAVYASLNEAGLALGAAEGDAVR